MKVLIEVTHLVKKYGKHMAVNDISFTAKEGEILGFLGPNGAGKSTTMNMMTGYLSSTSGSIKINGIDLLENPIEAKKNIGYLPEIPPLYLDMTVYDYLSFVAQLKKVKKADMKAHIIKILERIELTHVQTRLIKNLSKGYKQRVGLASALIGNPKLLILDEPTVGLDPKQIIEMRNLIKDLSKEHTIILSSHILSEISAICDKIMIINKGNMVAMDSPENLQTLFSHNLHITIRVRTANEVFLKALNALNGVLSVKILETVEEGTVEIGIEADEKIDVREQVSNLCYETGHPLLMMQSKNISLEDIFLKATTSDSIVSGSIMEDISPSTEVQGSHEEGQGSIRDEHPINEQLKEGASDEDHSL